MIARLWLVGLAVLAFGCGLLSSQPPDQPQHLFLGEYARTTHGQMTWFDHLVEFDPGTFDVRATKAYLVRPPRRIAVLPFTDTGSGNYVLDGAPVTVRKSNELADWRWTDSNRLRKIVEGYLAEREFETVNLVLIDAVLAAHGIDNDAKLSRLSPQELGRWLGADAVVYGEVTHYEVYYFYLVAGWRVKLKLKIVSTETGCPVVTASGTRFKMEVKPAVALRDIAFNSALDLTDLRDVDLRRAEEEAAREIVWRIPYNNEEQPPGRSSASPTIAKLQSRESPEYEAKVQPAQLSEPTRSGTWQALAPSLTQPLPASHSATVAAADSSLTGRSSELAANETPAVDASWLSASVGESADSAIASARSATENSAAQRNSSSEVERLNDSDPVPAFDPPAASRPTFHREDRAGGTNAAEPLDLALQTTPIAPALACPVEATWDGDEEHSAIASRPERFFLPEQRNLSHGRKTILDRLIETDPETFPIHVSAEYYANPPNKIAVLPFKYAGSGNLQVDKVIPVTFHLAQDREKWRWTVGNRVRRTFTAYLAQREFEMMPLPEINAVLKQHGVDTYDQLMHVSPQELGRWLNVDAVVYGDVTRYEGYYGFLVGGWTVGLRIRLVSTADGHELISAEGGRWAMVIQPALTLVDILIDSGLNLLESLRDIRVIRAEEETCREIALRIPEVPEHIRSLKSTAVRRGARREGLGSALATGDGAINPAASPSFQNGAAGPSSN